jgi:tetratricopeptide (TPR) repeat protein
MEMSNRRFLLWFVCVFFVLFTSGCQHLTKPGARQSPQLTQQMAPPGCNVIVITIDTLRADHLSCYGNKNVKTPYIDSLAREGVRFARNYTPVPVTLPSHTSIFTGLYPVYHQVRNNGTFEVSDKLETLAEVLKKNGYHTAAFIGSFVLDSRYGLAQGFDYYDDYLQKDTNQTLMIYNERTAGEVVQTANQWLDKNSETSGGANPFFMWLHCFDPHAPYEPPMPFSKIYRKNLYDGEIAYTDYALGRLISHLKKKNLFDKTLIVITADHGEGLGEHKEKTHAIFIYDATLHVPLIMRYPKAIPAGLAVQNTTSTVDIMPTVLDILKIRNRPHVQGKSLLGLVHGEKDFTRHELLCETYYPLYNHNWSPLEGLRTDQWKFIKAPRSELYDLKNDPKETVNLFEQKKDVARELEAQMKDLEKENSSQEDDFSAHFKMDKNTQDRLKSLGYVWTIPDEAKSGVKKDPYLLPDPKDMIATLDYLNMGTFYYTNGKYDKAVEQFKLMLKANPKDVFTHFVLGYIYDKQNLPDTAIKELQESIRLDPTYINAYNNLGTIYNRLGKQQEALAVFKIALQLNPDYLEVHDNLGVVYFALKEYDNALAEFQKAAEINPRGYEPYNNMGSVYLAMGNYAEAEKMILKALEINPVCIDGLNNLGSIYINQGHYAQGVERLQKLVKVDPNYSEAWANLGTAFLGEGNYEEAQKALDKAAHINPGVPKIYNCMGTLSMKRGNFKQAIEKFQKSLSLDPNSSETHYNLGIAYYSTGTADKAIEEYKRSIALDPSNPATHVNLGIAYFGMGRLDKSQAEYQEALRIAPSHLEALINLGVIYYNKGEYDRSIEEYKKALLINPNGIQSYVNTGLAYLAKGMIEDAIRQYQKALEINPNSLEVHVNLASAYFNQGEYHKALSEYQNITQLDPKNPIGYYGLGYSYFYQGLFDQAVVSLRNALRLRPDYLEARLLLDRALAVRQN